MSKSLMQQTEPKQCYLCGRKTCLEKHHVMSGWANRKWSEKYGLWIWLCADCHRGAEGAQYNKETNLMLRKEAQIAFEEVHGHEKWMQTFLKNYI